MATLLLLHQNLFTSSYLFMFICSAWSFLRYFRNLGVGSNLAGTLIIGEVLLIAQVLVGVALVVFGGVVPGQPAIHYLYGVAAILALPAMFFYTRGHAETKREALSYALICLFLFVMIIWRTPQTGRHAALVPYFLSLA